MADDKEYNPQKPIELKVDYKRVNTFISDYCKNISRNYTFIKTRNPLPEGTNFLFKIAVPGLPEILTLKGYVKKLVKESEAKRGGGGMEIFFQYDSEAERARLFAKIEKLIIENFGEVIGGKIRGYLEKR
ncbi:MAG: TIGR02266 family protein [Pseudomonadota bacterium]